MNRLLVPLLVVAALVALGAYAWFNLFSDEQPEGPDAARDGGRQAAAPETPGGPEGRVTSEPAPAPDRSVAVVEPSALLAEGEPQESGQGTISGAVMSEARQPIPGAKVALFRGHENPAFRAISPMQPTGLETTTGTDGTFTLERVPAGRGYVLAASHDEYAPAEVGGIVVRDNDFASRDVVLRQGFSVYGEVVDLYGVPLPGAVVELRDAMAGAGAAPGSPPPPPAETATPDANGKYAFKNVGFKAFSVTARAPSHAVCTRHENFSFTPAAGDKELNFALFPAVAIEGFVVDAQGIPIANARVEANQVNQLPESGTCSGRATSGPDGRFAIGDLVKGTFVLTATADGYSFKNHGQVESDTRDARIEMSRQGTIAGVVIDCATRRPISPFRLVLKRHTGGPVAALTNTVIDVKSPDGAFEFPGVDPGQWVVEARAKGYAFGDSQVVVLGQGESAREVTICLDKGGTIRGTVTDAAGQPIEGALVRLNEDNFVRNPLTDLFSAMPSVARAPQRSATTGKDGAFVLDLLVPRTYQIEVRSPGFAHYQQNGVEVVRNQETSLGRVTLVAGGTVKGTCLLEGRPYADGMVSLTNAEGVFEQQKPEYDGTFEFKNLKPGEYKLSVMPERMNGQETNPFLRMILAQKTEQQVNVGDGQVSQVTLVVQPPPQ